MRRALQVIVTSVRSYTVTIQTMATSRLSRFCISSYVIGCVVEHAVVINGRTMTIGDMVNEELEIVDIYPDEIEFYFRGLILGRGI